MLRKFPTIATNGVRALALLALSAAAALVWEAGSARAEGAAVSTTHQWVSTMDQGDGTYAVTYRFRFTNTGEVDIGGLTVSVIDAAPGVVLAAENLIVVGALPFGSTATVTSDLLSYVPIGTEMPISLMIGSGQGTDSGGDPVSVAIVSEEDTVQ